MRDRLDGLRRLFAVGLLLGHGRYYILQLTVSSSITW
jgi:hypothetical protein